MWSSTYSRNLSEGHTQPAPEIGAPALSWHIGVWPKHDADPNHTEVTFTELGSVPWNRLFNEFKQKRKEIYIPAEEEGGEFNRFLVKLQKNGCLLSDIANTEQMLLTKQTGRIPDTLKFDRLKPTFLCFTLWWRDEGEEQTGFTANHPPSPSAIRVRVSVKLFFDHTTVSFYMDVGKPWDQPSVYSSVEAVGARRKRVFEAVETVKRICQGQIDRGAVNLPLLPEPFIKSDEAKLLLESSDYLYSKIWGEFCSDFDFHMEDIVTSKGRCFPPCQ
jgi:hypothetical protein